MPRWQALSFRRGFYSFRSPGFLLIFNGTTCPASFKWICSLSLGFASAMASTGGPSVVESQKKRQVCTQHKLYRRAERDGSGGKGRMYWCFWEVIWGTRVYLHKDPLRNFSWVSDLEKLSVPEQLLWLLEAPGLSSRPPPLLQKDLTQHYPPNELQWSLSSTEQMLPHWPPCFHTGPDTMWLPHSSQDSLLKTWVTFWYPLTQCPPVHFALWVEPWLLNSFMINPDPWLQHRPCSPSPPTFQLQEPLSSQINQSFLCTVPWASPQSSSGFFFFFCHPELSSYNFSIQCHLSLFSTFTSLNLLRNLIASSYTSCLYLSVYFHLKYDATGEEILCLAQCFVFSEPNSAWNTICTKYL